MELLTLDLLAKKPDPEPFPFVNFLDDEFEWDLEDHDEWALTEEQLQPQFTETTDEIEIRKKGNNTERYK